MEIKKIEKHAVDYPKTNEISKEDIKRNIPKKFLKFAVALAFVQGSLTKVNASIINTQLAGDIEYVEPIPIVTAGVLEYIHPMYTVSSNVESISLCVLALSVISIGVTKIVYKIKKIEKPVPKGLKILAILSGVLAVVARIGIFIFGN